MTNSELKEYVYEHVDDENIVDKVVVLEGDEFADGCVGITIDNHLVYSYERLVESLVKNNNIPYEEAAEHIEFNTIRSLPYFANQGLIDPFIIHEFDY